MSEAKNRPGAEWRVVQAFEMWRVQRRRSKHNVWRTVDICQTSDEANALLAARSTQGDQ